jgi:hypothetical protein
VGLAVGGVAVSVGALLSGRAFHAQAVLTQAFIVDAHFSQTWTGAGGTVLGIAVAVDAGFPLGAGSGRALGWINALAVHAQLVAGAVHVLLAPPGVLAAAQTGKGDQDKQAGRSAKDDHVNPLHLKLYNCSLARLVPVGKSLAIWRFGWETAGRSREFLRMIRLSGV